MSDLDLDVIERRWKFTNVDDGEAFALIAEVRLLRAHRDAALAIDAFDPVFDSHQLGFNEARSAFRRALGFPLSVNGELEMPSPCAECHEVYEINDLDIEMFCPACHHKASDMYDGGDE